MNNNSLCTNSPVFLGSNTASLTVTVREVNPVTGEGNYPGVSEDRPGVGHEQHEDDHVEHHHVETGPQAPGHRLHHYPSETLFCQKGFLKNSLYRVIIK